MRFRTSGSLTPWQNLLLSLRDLALGLGDLFFAVGD